MAWAAGAVYLASAAVCCGLAAGGGLLALYLLALGGARLQHPGLERWESGDEPAWYSPPIAARLRDNRTQPQPWERRRAGPARN